MIRIPGVTDRPARLLIVDDERKNRELLEVMLAHEGYELVSVENGEEALAAVARQLPDLVLLDVMMPGMSGYEVAAKLKGNPVTKGIPIIMVTALDDRKARMLGLNAGAEDFLTKPVDRAELSVRVRNLVELKAYGDYYDNYSQVLETEVTARAADLVESERLYRSTFDAAPVGIVHVGLDGRWLRVNQRLCELLGYTHEELESSAVQELVQANEAEGETAAVRHMAEGALHRHVVPERRYPRKDGAFIWARVNMSVHRDSGGEAQHLISVVEDITAAKALEAQVQQASKMDAVGRLASGIAHDFNNLLSVILSYSEILASDAKDGDPIRADLDEIKSAGLRAVDLTRQLLAFSRQQVLQPQVVDLTEVFAGMETMLRRLIGEDVELIALATAGLGKIVVDPGQMEQVIMNLAVNARDAMPQGGRLTVETTEVSLNEAQAAELGMSQGRHVVLAVTDDGVGMDQPTQARMFEPFFTTKELGKGTGLGLATVFGIVRQSGGTISVSSAIGRGTTFKLYFPVANKSVIARASMAAPEGRALGGSETILLVEDEERVRILARTILRKYGYNVLDAQSGGDALLLCEQHSAPIHLLLADVVMPRMSGLQLAARLLPVQPRMKVLYMSGYMGEAITRHGIEESTIALLQKPITPEALARRVRDVLDAVG